MIYRVILDQGSRDHMEDRYCVKKVSLSTHVAGVFDGHGNDTVSTFCSKYLPNYLSQSLTRLDHVSAVKDALVRLDASAKAQFNGPDGGGGTTACIVMVLPDKIITANVGDSRAILFSRGMTHDLSKDHKPSDASELDRIMRNGGFVTQPHQTDGVHRVMGRLSLSRALGDWDLRPYVSAASDVTLHERSPHDAFVVIASDGIWDVMSSDEVATHIDDVLTSGGKPKAALEGVLAESRRRGSGDNVTILLLDVKQKML